MTEKERAYYREYYAKNKEKIRAKHRDHYSKNYASKRMLKQYGITIEQYDEMLRAQNNSCAICKTDTPGGRGRWAVDHCHSTGRVRGLLCASCNLGLGHFKDNQAFLAEAISYLNK